MKYIKFNVSEERFTHYRNEIGFENIDHLLNELLDQYEQRDNHGSDRN